MARMIPKQLSPEIKSNAERKIFEWFRGRFRYIFTEIQRTRNRRRPPRKDGPKEKAPKEKMTIDVSSKLFHGINMSYGIIYKSTGPTGKVYIGQTIRKLQDRINGHKCDALTNNAGGRFYYAIRKYGLDSFSWETIDTANDHEDLQQKEIYWIAFYKSNNADHGYNLTAGGDQPVVNKEVGKILGEKRKGKKHTTETLQKMKEAKNKLWSNPDYRQHMVEVHRGKILPPEQRKKWVTRERGIS